MSRPQVISRESRHVLYDADRYPEFDSEWVNEAWWRAQGARQHMSTGRGLVLMLDRGSESWVFRHYHRGGLVSRLIHDHYLWSGLEQTRSFREWHLLAAMHAEGLPVPRPVAAAVTRDGPIYRADIVTVLLVATRPLSSYLAQGGIVDGVWTEIGQMLRQFHDFGVDHPDLTAHNILIDNNGRCYLLDFDDAKRRRPGTWRRRRIRRLQRSLRKVALETGTLFDGDAWATLLEAYQADRR
jgi:3-deoxy-D-manno-octulosonic acid kinase